MGRERKRRGFTLIETVVTVGIVAALAAVVYPQVVKQFDNADPTRAAEDLNSIKTAIETFKINVRPHLPLELEDLTNRVQASFATADSTAFGTAYTTSDATNWNGPYLALAIPDATLPTVTVVTTGFGGTIRNGLSRYDIDNATGGAPTSLAAIANAEFLAVRIDGLSEAAFNSLNALLDGSTENTNDLRRWQGRLRCPDAYVAGTACPAAYFLAVPIR